MVYIFFKKFLNFIKIFFLIINIKPTPQLNVFNISFSVTLLFFNQVKTFFVFILSKSIFAHLPFGIILDRLSLIPPPVICAHPLINFRSINLVISFT